MPSAAPDALRGTRSTAISPPMKQISTPIAIPNRHMARTFTNQLSPP